MPRIFRDDLAAEAGLSHSWQSLDYDNSLHKVQILNAINRWGWYPGDRLTLRAGGDYRFSCLNSSDMGRRNRHDGGVYLTADYWPQGSFLVIPSVKGIFSGPGAESPAIAVPKLGFLWNVNDNFSIKNNYFRSFKHPDFEDLYWADDGINRGNPDLKPEDGWGGDLGFNYQHKNYFTLGGSFFAQWTTDSIHWAEAPGGKWRPQNVGAALFFGSENKVTITPFKNRPLKENGIHLRDAALSLSWQFLLGRLLSYGYTWKSDKHIPYMPTHTLGVSLNIPWGVGENSFAGSAVISGHFETTRFADTANIKKLPPSFLLNIDINQALSKNLAAFLVARNVLNHSYESFDSYPMPGVTFTLGMKINYEKN
jgi:vitamin B12 transporter